MYWPLEHVQTAAEVAAAAESGPDTEDKDTETTPRAVHKGQQTKKTLKVTFKKYYSSPFVLYTTTFSISINAHNYIHTHLMY